jgi:hypothetical protein
LGTGDGNLGVRTIYPMPNSGGFVGSADLDGDKVPELVAVRGSFSTVFRGIGDGSFAFAGETTVPNGAVRAAFQDLDDDGRSDIAIACSSTNVVSILMNETPPVDVPDGVSDVFFSQAQPNPARGATDIHFALASASSSTSLRVFDASGRLVATLYSGGLPGGTHIMRWEGRSDRGAMVAAGIYFYELQTSTHRLVKRLTMLR